MFNLQRILSVRETSPLDHVLLFTVFLLLLIGLIGVYSSSYIWADFSYGDQFFFLKRQSLFVSIGLCTMFIFSRIPYVFWKENAGLILLLCFVLLVIVLIPGIGIVRGGAQSWIGVGAFSIQPSEFIKLGLILFLAKRLAYYRKNIISLYKGFLPLLFLIILAFGLIMMQPDLGTGVVLVLTCMLVIYIAGAKLRYFVSLGFIGMLAFVYLIISAPYRIRRITAFLNPWEDPLGDGFQIIQSLYALGPGGLLGVGLGKSLQKHFYLPEPQTDFIFAIIGEELGFLGGFFVILLFVVLLWRGTKVSLTAPCLFSRYVSFGIISMFTIQAMINLSVVIGLIPVTGITLPFLSYGGSSLTLTLASIGILLNISRHSKI